MCVILWMRKEIIVDIWPNRDDSGYVRAYPFQKLKLPNEKVTNEILRHENYGKYPRVSRNLRWFKTLSDITRSLWYLIETQLQWARHSFQYRSTTTTQEATLINWTRLNSQKADTQTVHKYKFTRLKPLIIPRREDGSIHFHWDPKPNHGKLNPNAGKSLGSALSGCTANACSRGAFMISCLIPRRRVRPDGTTENQKRHHPGGHGALVTSA
jgi:hypothetical protein